MTSAVESDVKKHSFLSSSFLGYEYVPTRVSLFYEENAKPVMYTGTKLTDQCTGM